MRVTQEIYYRTVLRDLGNLYLDQVETNRHIATGYKVNAPSDAPAYAVTILDSRQLLMEVDQYRNNLEWASSWMTASEEAMRSISDLLQRAQALAEQMANGTIDEEQYQSTASEVGGIIEQIITLANTRVEGGYIFGGSRTEASPVSSAVQVDDPATLVSDSGPGHGIIASLYQDPNTGNYAIRFTTAQNGDNIVVPPTSPATTITLGDNLYSVGYFSNWYEQQNASSSRPDIWRSVNTVATTSSLVSDAVGEVLAWDTDPTNTTLGLQIYRTDAELTITGSCSIGFSGASFSTVFTGVTSATDLVNRINESGIGHFFGWLDPNDNTKVNIISRGTGSFVISELPPSPNLTIDQDITATELVEEINAGRRAQGVLHIDGDAAGFAPDPDQTVTLGNYTWTWREITGGNTYSTAALYANDLANFIVSHTEAFTATTVTNGNDAWVQVQARAVGMAGNVTLASSNTTISTTGSLYGGFDGTNTQSSGGLYITGSGDLRLGTTIRATVLAVEGDDVTLRLQWYDDDGALQTQDVTLSTAGDSGAQSITGTGGLSIYRDDLTFHEGAVYTLTADHYQGNDQDLEINFSEAGGRLVYNWNAEQLLGDNLSIPLLGETAQPKSSSIVGTVSLAGVYRGLEDRQITFDVISGGSVPGGQVKFRVTFKDDQGVEHVHEIALRGAGIDNAAVIPINGHLPKVDLSGQTATPDPGNTTDGDLKLAGNYRGLTNRQYTWQVTAVSGNQVTFDVSWVDDQGVSHTESVQTTGYGSDNAVTIPGGDGVQFYLEQGSVDFAVGDQFTYSIQMHPQNAGDGIFFYIDNQTFNTGDSFYYEIDQSQGHVLDVLNQWRYQMENGDRETAQNYSGQALAALKQALEALTDYTAEAGTRQNRITVRQTVLDEHDKLGSENLKNLQETDLTEAFLTLKLNQNAYNASLKAISVLADLYLVNLL